MKWKQAIKNNLPSLWLSVAFLKLRINYLPIFRSGVKLVFEIEQKEISFCESVLPYQY